MARGALATGAATGESTGDGETLEVGGVPGEVVRYRVAGAGELVEGVVLSSNLISGLREADVCITASSILSNSIALVFE